MLAGKQLLTNKLFSLHERKVVPMAYDSSHVTLTIEDAYARTKQKRVELVSVDAAQMEIDSGVAVTTYQGVMEGIIRKASVVGDMAYAGPVPAGVNIDTGVTCSVQLDGRPEKASLKWPTPLPSLFLGDGTLNTADALVVAVQDMYGTGVGGIARLSDGEAISSIISGKLDK